MWFWLRNQLNQQAKNAQGRRERSRKQTAVPKVKLLLDRLEDRVTPSVTNLRTGILFTNTSPALGDAIQKAIDYVDPLDNNVTNVNSTRAGDTLLVDNLETYLGFNIPATKDYDGPGVSPPSQPAVPFYVTIQNQSHMRPIVRPAAAGYGAQILPAGVGAVTPTTTDIISGLDFQPSVSGNPNLFGVVVGQSASAASATVQILNNNIGPAAGTGFSYGVRLQPGILGLNNARVEFNTIQGSGLDGVHILAKVDGSVVDRNIITRSGGAGIHFDLTYFNTGAPNLFTLNSITGNFSGVLNESNNPNSVPAFGQTVNAPLNYWGAANGPSGSQVVGGTTYFGGFGNGQTVTAATPLATATVASPSVDVTPFLVNPTNFIPTPGVTSPVPGYGPTTGPGIVGDPAFTGFVPDLQQIRVTNANLQTGGVGRVQEPVNDFSVAGSNPTTLSFLPLQPPFFAAGPFVTVGVTAAVEPAVTTPAGLASGTPGVYSERVTIPATIPSLFPVGGPFTASFPFTLQALNNADKIGYNNQTPAISLAAQPNAARGVETILNPPAGGAPIITLNTGANNVAIKGFTLDGNDPTTILSPPVTGTDTTRRDIGEGIDAGAFVSPGGVAGFAAQNLIVKNFQAGGIVAQGFPTAPNAAFSAPNNISGNLITDTEFGAIAVLQNFYGSISANAIAPGGPIAGQGGAGGSGLNFKTQVGITAEMYLNSVTSTALPALGNFLSIGGNFVTVGDTDVGAAITGIQVDFINTTTTDGLFLVNGNTVTAAAGSFAGTASGIRIGGSAAVPAGTLGANIVAGQVQASANTVTGTLLGPAAFVFTDGIFMQNISADTTAADNIVTSTFNGINIRDLQVSVTSSIGTTVTGGNITGAVEGILIANATAATGAQTLVTLSGVNSSAASLTTIPAGAAAINGAPVSAALVVVDSNTAAGTQITLSVLGGTFVNTTAANPGPGFANDAMDFLGDTGSSYILSGPNVSVSAPFSRGIFMTDLATGATAGTATFNVSSASITASGSNGQGVSVFDNDNFDQNPGAGSTAAILSSIGVGGGTPTLITTLGAYAVGIIVSGHTGVNTVAIAANGTAGPTATNNNESTTSIATTQITLSNNLDVTAGGTAATATGIDITMRGSALPRFTLNASTTATNNATSFSAQTPTLTLNGGTSGGGGNVISGGVLGLHLTGLTGIQQNTASVTGISGLTSLSRDDLGNIAFTQTFNATQTAAGNVGLFIVLEGPRPTAVPATVATLPSQIISANTATFTAVSGATTLYTGTVSNALANLASSYAVEDRIIDSLDANGTSALAGNAAGGGTNNRGYIRLQGANNSGQPLGTTNTNVGGASAGNGPNTVFATQFSQTLGLSGLASALPGFSGPAFGAPLPLGAIAPNFNGVIQRALDVVNRTAPTGGSLAQDTLFVQGGYVYNPANPPGQVDITVPPQAIGTTVPSYTNGTTATAGLPYIFTGFSAGTGTFPNGPGGGNNNANDPTGGQGRGVIIRGGAAQTTGSSQFVGTNPLARTTGANVAGESTLIVQSGVDGFDIATHNVTINGFSMIGDQVAPANPAVVFPTTAVNAIQETPTQVGGVGGLVSPGNGFFGTAVLNTFINSFSGAGVGLAASGTPVTGNPGTLFTNPTGNNALKWLVQDNEIANTIINTGTANTPVLVANTGVGVRLTGGAGTNSGWVVGNRIHDYTNTTTVGGIPQGTAVALPSQNTTVTIGDRFTTTAGSSVVLAGTFGNDFINNRTGVFVGGAGLTNTVVSGNAFSPALATIPTALSINNTSVSGLYAAANWYGTTPGNTVAASANRTTFTPAQVDQTVGPNTVDYSPWLELSQDRDILGTGDGGLLALSTRYLATLTTMDVAPEIGSPSPILSPQLDPTIPDPIQEGFNLLPATAPTTGQGAVGGLTVNVEGGVYNRDVNFNVAPTKAVTMDFWSVPNAVVAGAPTMAQALLNPTSVTVVGNVTLSAATILRVNVSASGPSDLLTVSGGITNQPFTFTGNGATIDGPINNPSILNPSAPNPLPIPGGVIPVVTAINGASVPGVPNNLNPVATLTYAVPGATAAVALAVVNENTVPATANRIVLSSNPTGSAGAFVDDGYNIVADVDSSGGLSFGDVVMPTETLTQLPAGLPGSVSAGNFGNMVFGLNAFSTIQNAIDAAAAGPSTANPTVINVLDGTYAGSVNVNKANMTLRAFTTLANTVGGGNATIQPVVAANGSAVTLSAANDSIVGNAAGANSFDHLVISGGPSGAAANVTGINVTGVNALVQDVQSVNFAGNNSTGVRVLSTGTAQILSDTVTGNFIGVRVSGGTAKLQDNTLSNNNTAGTIQNAGLLVSQGASVDAGGSAVDGFTASTGNNTFAGYTGGATGPQAIVNRNDSSLGGTGGAAVPPTGAGAVLFPNVSAQNNIFPGVTTYGGVERIVNHFYDDPLNSFVDYRNAQSAAATPLALPSVVPNSYRFIAQTAGDNLADRQDSLIRAVSFQVDSPVSAAANVLTISRSGPVNLPWYGAPLPTGAMTTGAGGQVVLNGQSIDGASGLTTVVLTFASSTFTEPNSAFTVTGGALPAGGVSSSSLVDGYYTAVANASGLSLLFGGSGVSGNATPATRNFVRFYGDLNSNLNDIGTVSQAVIDGQEFSAYQSITSRPYEDMNGNGVIDPAETTTFNARANSTQFFGALPRTN